MLTVCSYSLGFLQELEWWNVYPTSCKCCSCGQRRAGALRPKFQRTAPQWEPPVCSTSAGNAVSPGTLGRALQVELPQFLDPVPALSLVAKVFEVAGEAEAWAAQGGAGPVQTGCWAGFRGGFPEEVFLRCLSPAVASLSYLTASGRPGCWGSVGGQLRVPRGASLLQACHGSITRLFTVDYCKYFSLPYGVLNVFFSLVYFVVRI